MKDTSSAKLTSSAPSSRRYVRPPTHQVWRDRTLGKRSESGGRDSLHRRVMADPSPTWRIPLAAMPGRVHSVAGVALRGHQGAYAEAPSLAGRRCARCARAGCWPACMRPDAGLCRGGRGQTAPASRVPALRASTVAALRALDDTVDSVLVRGAGARAFAAAAQRQWIVNRWLPCRTPGSDVDARRWASARPRPR